MTILLKQVRQGLSKVPDALTDVNSIYTQEKSAEWITDDIKKMLKIDLTLTLVVTIKQPTVEQTRKDLVSNTRIDFIETIYPLLF